MPYSERKLTREEADLAWLLQTYVPRAHRLHVCQQVADFAESMRDAANDALIASDTYEAVRKQVWDSLHFPRYRFFNVAMPDGAWGQFAEDRDAERTA